MELRGDIQLFARFLVFRFYEVWYQRKKKKDNQLSTSHITKFCSVEGQRVNLFLKTQTLSQSA